MLFPGRTFTVTAMSMRMINRSCSSNGCESRNRDRIAARDVEFGDWQTARGRALHRHGAARQHPEHPVRTTNRHRYIGSAFELQRPPRCCNDRNLCRVGVSLQSTSESDQLDRGPAWCFPVHDGIMVVPYL